MADEMKNMDLFGVDGASEYLGFSKPYLYRLTKEKRIPHINFGRHILFRKVDLFEWLGSMVTCDCGGDGDLEELEEV